MPKLRCLSALWSALVLLTTQAVAADDPPRACRSVHLSYVAPAGDAFYNEVTVEESVDQTYFCVCGWGHGYFGIQQLGAGKKILLFSVWDPGSQDNPQDVPDAERVKLLHKDPAVRVKRFGGEGTGGQSFYDLDWQPQQTYRFLVTAQPDGQRTAFSGFVYLPEAQAWKHLITFSTLANGDRLEGYYSFVEDFRRDGVSATQTRRATYGNGWVRVLAGEWQSLTQAKFTADDTPTTHVDAGPLRDRFFLATGGSLKNEHAPLWSVMERQTSGTTPPDDVLELLKAQRN